MSRVRGRNTGPEWTVRRALRTLSVGYRLHDSRLPGRPDIVLAGRHRAIFVNGCFWHRHENCKLASMPKTNTEFWRAKFAENEARDRRTVLALEAANWQVLTIWQCETVDPTVLEDRLRTFLGLPPPRQRG